jgi:hypothetical protein
LSGLASDLVYRAGKIEKTNRQGGDCLDQAKAQELICTKGITIHSVQLLRQVFIGVAFATAVILGLLVDVQAVKLASV